MLAFCSFIVSFVNNAPDAEKDSVAVQEFLGNMEAAFRAHPLWSGSSEEELESAGEVSIIPSCITNFFEIRTTVVEFIFHLVFKLLDSWLREYSLNDINCF